MAGKKLSAFQGLSSLLFVCSALALGYAMYLHSTGRELIYQAEVVKNTFFVVPIEVLRWIRDGDYSGTFIAVLVEIVYMTIYTSLCFGLGYAIVYLRNTKTIRDGSYNYDSTNTSELEIKQFPDITSPNLLSVHDNDIKLVMVPDKESKPVEKVFPEVYLRLDRGSVEINRKPSTQIEKLELALMEILSAHRNWTCDPQQHHSDAGLLDHSVYVAKKLNDLSEGHKLSKIIGLSHDIGKIIAYRPKKKNGEIEWESVTNLHAKLSAQIVRMLPEFKKLDYNDRRTINTVLSYCHTPHRIPTKTPPEVVRLLQKLRQADSLGIRADQQRGHNLSEDEQVVAEVVEAITTVIPTLNINSYKGKDSEGWTLSVVDYVAITENAIRQNLGAHLKSKVATQLQLKVPYKNNKRHPATRIIRKALQKMDLIIEEKSGINPQDGLFDIKVGKMRFKGVFLLKREPLVKQIPDIVEAWGESEYSLKFKEPARKSEIEEEIDASETE